MMLRAATSQLVAIGCAAARRYLVVLTLLGAMPAQSGLAQGVERVLLGQFGDWAVYVANLGDQRKVCYAGTIAQWDPTRPADKSYVTISMRPSDRVWNELSIMTDDSFDSNSDAVGQISGEAFALYTRGHDAWIKKLGDGGRVVQLMRQESILVVRGMSTAGMPIVQRYSLKGLGPAVDRAVQECGGQVIGTIGSSLQPRKYSAGAL
jgi:hypothetical protein